MRGAGEGTTGFGPQPGGKQGSLPCQHLRGWAPSRGASRPRRAHPDWRRASGGKKSPDYHFT